MRRGRAAINVWPGWVDALATLVMVVMFLLMVFMVAQFYTREALTGRENQLKRLSGQIGEIADLLSMERQTNVDLRASFAQLSTELQASVAERDDLSNRLGQMTQRLEQVEAEASRNLQKLTEANKTLTSNRETIESQVRQVLALQAARDELAKRLAEDAAKLKTSDAERQRLASTLAETNKSVESARERNEDLARQIMALQTARDDLAKRLAEEAARLKATQDDAAKRLAEEAARLKAAQGESARLGASLTVTAKSAEAARERIDQLVRQIAGLEELKSRLEAEVKGKDEAAKTAADAMALLEKRLRESQATAEQEKAGGEKARDELSLLNRQVAALREQLARVGAALELAETKGKDQEVQIADLGRRLNVALASRVQELARYRSEFFGRLRETLGERADIRIVGDRFVLQSEVLFESGAADLGDEGKRQIANLAATLKQIAQRIPPEINWILRVDGHTDRKPIATAQFPSNWELSVARALSVVRMLAAEGIPAERLAATGFGEFQPLDQRDDEIGRRRNRRIEIKFDQR